MFADIIDIFASFLLKCNFAPTKTACMANLMCKDPGGCGLTKVKHNTFAITLNTRAYGIIDVPIVHEYKNLGMVNPG